MPLSGIGLWLAESITPRSAPSDAGQVRDRGGRQHADPQHVHARAGQARHHGGLQELPGRAWIPSDHGHRPVALERAHLGEHMRRRDRQAERELGRQVRVGDAAHTVRTEESSHWSFLRDSQMQASDDCLGAA